VELPRWAVSVAVLDQAAERSKNLQTVALLLVSFRFVWFRENYALFRCKRCHACLSKYHGMSSSMRAAGWPLAMASSVALR
jgi:hypothetical protein